MSKNGSTQPTEINEWKLAVDHELTNMQSTADSYPSAKEAVKALIDWHVAVATDPVLQQPAERMSKADYWNKELSSWSDEDFILVFHERPDLADRLRKVLSEPSPAQKRRERLRSDPVKAAALDRARERIETELANRAEPVKVDAEASVQSAETILTDEQKAQFVTDIINYGTGFTTPLFAVVESIEQAILQSPTIQALRKDAERYRRLRKGGIDDVAVVRGLGAMDYGASAVIATYSDEIDGDDLDAAIDYILHNGEDGIITLN